MSVNSAVGIVVMVKPQYVRIHRGLTPVTVSLDMKGTYHSNVKVGCYVIVTCIVVRFGPYNREFGELRSYICKRKQSRIDNIGAQMRMSLPGNDDTYNVFSLSSSID